MVSISNLLLVLALSLVSGENSTGTIAEAEVQTAIYQEGDFEREEASPFYEAPYFDVHCTRIISDGVARMRYCGNRDIYQDNDRVTRAIILIHGSGLDAHNYYQTTEDAANDEGVDLSRTDIIAPQFFEGKPASGTWQWYYIWPFGWRSGDPAISHPSRSSFDVLDHIVEELVSHRRWLHTIVVAGQSAGGQYVNRYSMGQSSRTSHGRNMVFWSANPFFYTWLTSQRPNPDSSCPEYNNYPYGLSNRNAYMGRLSASALQNNAINRRIFRTVGENDATNEGSCSSRTQGSNRRDRWENHKVHMKRLCTNILTRRTPRPKSRKKRLEKKKKIKAYCSGVVGNRLHLLVPSCGHGHVCSWNSNVGREILFGNTKPPERISNGIYEIRAVHSNKCVSVKRSSRRDGGKVVQSKPHATTNQRFRFTRLSNGFYEIKALHSGKCLDVPYSKQHGGTGIEQYKCNRTTNQLWRLDRILRHVVVRTRRNKHKRVLRVYYEIRAMHSDKCLDVPNSSKASGVQLIQYQCFGTNNQRYRLLRR